MGIAERIGFAGDGSSLLVSNVKLILVHVDTSTTNLTAGVASSGIDGTNDAIIGSFFLELGEVTRQLVKKGEKLRLSVTYDTTGTSSAIIKAYHNPSGGSETLTDGGIETITSSNTQLIMEVPFEIDTS